jgi:ribose 5-phosphate isomerase A
MSASEEKRAAARAAVELVQAGSLIGVGTGSTTDMFVDELAAAGRKIAGAVPSSRATAERLARHGIPRLELPEVERLALYVDGADEVDPRRNLIKGGGGALTGEKIVAAASERFVCIVDESKLVARLGAFPLPIEVLAMARRHVAAALARLGGRAVPRAGYVTDSGNVVLDVHGLYIDDPQAMESTLNQSPGVVTNGLFARRRPELVIVGTAGGVRRLESED